MATEEKLEIGFSAWITIIAGISFAALFFESMRNLLGADPDDQLRKNLIGAFGAFLFFANGLTYRIVFTPSGHQTVWRFGSKGKDGKVLFKSRFRQWHSVIVDLDLGWPIYALNIMETTGHFPVLMRGIVGNYDDACLYILKRGKSADIKPKAMEYLRRIATEKGMEIK